MKIVFASNGRSSLKRSEINLFLRNAIDFFEANHFSLPPFANWTLDMWRQRGHEADEIRERQLGWDLTDFNSGTFTSCGLTLFTLRNGGFGGVGPHRSYAEKIMMVREGQLTPLHYHDRKAEDIINRGGVTATGDLIVQLYQSAEDCRLADTPVTVACDGVMQRIQPGGTIRLRAGESITLPPRVYHSFHAVNGDALIGEISSVNDDAVDNHFFLPLSRFPTILEDAPPLRLLCTEYPKPNNHPTQEA
jgi:D-lyxose ketol-isomerase